MITVIVVQCACILFSLICLGQVIRKDATNFDKFLFGIFCLIFLVTCIIVQGVK